MKGSSRASYRVLAATVLVASLVGCGSGQNERSDPAGSDPRADASEPARSVISDPFLAKDLSFFGEARPEAVALPRPPVDLAEAVELSSAVVIAEVTDVVHTRTLVGETPTDVIDMIGVVIQPTETIRGRLPSNSDEVVVEFLAGGSPEEAVKSMRSSIPSGQAVWFLREEDAGTHLREASGNDIIGETTYFVTHLHGGVFVQGETHVVVGPWRESRDASDDVRTVRSYGESFDTLDTLISYLRELE